MEPEWEARFEPNSYGFRPGRSCHDAIEAIFGGIRLKAKYVLDADIAKCLEPSSQCPHIA
jgi:RNA-directed DNA polymerase